MDLFIFQSQKQNLDLSRQAKFASTPSFALFVTLKNVVCKIGEDAEVLMSLYDPIESKFIRSVHTWTQTLRLALHEKPCSPKHGCQIITLFRDLKSFLTLFLNNYSFYYYLILINNYISDIICNKNDNSLTLIWEP